MQVELRESITVQRSIEDCFRYVQDFSTIEQWDPGVYRSVKLTKGKVGAGSEFDLLLHVAGKHVAMRYTLDRVEKNALLVFSGHNRALNAVDTIRFTELDSARTRINYNAVLTLNILPQGIKPLMMPSFRRLGEKAVKGLQRALSIPEKVLRTPFSFRVKDRFLLPALYDFTERGYLNMPSKGLSQFMDGKTVVLTGPTAGLGLAAACELSRLGARLILIGRGQQRLEAAKQTVLNFSGAATDSVELFTAELSLVAEVEQVANLVKARHKKIDVLINNAGVLPAEREETAEGNELTLAVNLLAPAALTLALQPLLKAARGRVINVASGGMYLAGLKLDDLQYTRGTFDGAKAYARAKRALLVMSEHLGRRWQADGVDFYVMHPGWAATPGVAKSLPSFNKRLAGYLRDARMGADTMVWLAAATEVAGHTGQFWFDRQRHCTSVLPGTAVLPYEALELQRRVESLIVGEEGVLPHLAEG
ncbi:MAG: dehydrogenase/reductase SDR family protein 12 [Bermanella sp.]|jgi:dehydrogenase/reductase SDR family protein 12